MLLACLFVDNSAMPTDFYGLSAVMLLRSHELYAAVTVLMVVPVEKRRVQMVGLAPARKCPTKVIREVCRCAELQF